MIMTLNEWIIKGQTGISSKTMWAAITGAVSYGEKGSEFDVPHDPSDFNRCLMFVRQCNISSSDLQVVKQVFPWWAPQIDAWDRMVELMNEERPTGRFPKLYDLMQELEAESMRLAGWVQDSPNMWSSGNHTTFKVKL